MKSPRKSLIALGFAALLAVPGYLYYQTEAINVDLQYKVVPALRELKQFDAEWDANILKARVGIHSNYDPVTTPLQHVRALRDRLIRGVQMVRGGTLESALHKMEQAFVDKEELVEQFKSQNSLLQNSLRYFPTAVEELKSLPVDLALATKADRLLADILRFNLIPNPGFAGEISATIDSISDRSSAYPANVRESLELLCHHARIILRQRMVEDEIMANIASTPTAQTIDALGNALDNEFQEKLQAKELYRTYLFMYSGFLLVLLTYAAWRLMHSYRVIARVNKRLQAANESLEQRVAERTAELERQAAQLAELATHDALTGLINRRQLMVRLEQSIQRAGRHGTVLALMFFDLDGFKRINDTCGHAAGDVVLKEVATRIQRHVRKDDAFARLGGDEFVILLNDVQTQEGAMRVAEAALGELHTITEIDGKPVRLSASIGISSLRGITGSAPSAELLLNQADHAMYQAKQAGKRCYRFSMPLAWSAEANA